MGHDGHISIGSPDDSVVTPTAVHESPTYPANEHDCRDLRTANRVSTYRPPKRRRLESQDTKSVDAEALCSACRNVFEKWDIVESDALIPRLGSTLVEVQDVMRAHHPNPKSLENSVRLGCGFCTLLQQVLAEALAFTSPVPGNIHETTLSTSGRLRLYKMPRTKFVNMLDRRQDIWTWAAEIHFASDDKAPKVPMGYFEADEFEHRLKPSEHFVYLIPKVSPGGLSYLGFDDDISFPGLPAINMSLSQGNWEFTSPSYDVSDPDPHTPNNFHKPLVLSTPTSPPTHRHLVTGTRTEIMSMATQWMQKCQQLHVKCKSSTASVSERKSPTRLIEIQSTGQRLTLWKSSDTSPEYATLSHCWGNLKILRLLKDNLATLQQSIPSESLCRTFRDAIFIARELGFKYLWIDSLCIVQDDPADWRREAAVMNEVYTHSSLNIAATSAPDGSHGCFVDRDSTYLACHDVTAGSRQYNCVNSKFYTQNVINTPLGHRGWVVQERLLAPRTLHFGKNQIFWVCTEQVACSAYPDGLHMQLIDRNDRPELSADTAWMSIVSQYSSCSLTKSSDKLVAISGLTRKMANRKPDQYLAGIWRSNAPRELCWVAEEVGGNTPSKSETYLAPTWSWASVDSKVRFASQSYKDWDPMITVVKTDIRLVGNDPYGQVESVMLWVSCKFFFKKLVLSQNDKTLPRFGDERVPLTVSWDTTDDPERQCYFLPVLQEKSSEEIQGLILGSTGKERGEYYRIGHFRAVVEGWPYERLEIAAKGFKVEPEEFVDDFQDGDGALLKQFIKLI